MKVILAGYSKTGTKTMCQAFKILGYNTYDTLEHGYYHRREWVKIITEGSTEEDFQRMYEGVDAVTDLPCYVFWEQIHEAFPDAKIILTVRDEDKWYKSLVDQFDSLNSSYWLLLITVFSPVAFLVRRYDYHTLKIFGHVAPFPSQKVTLYGETLLKNMYRQHNNYVLQKAPKDKLLVYEVSQGWKPLCEFLGENVPETPFPHKNKGSSLIDEMWKENEIMKVYIRSGLASVGVVSILASYIGYKVYKNVNFANLLNVGSNHVSMLTNFTYKLFT